MRKRRIASFLVIVSVVSAACGSPADQTATTAEPGTTTSPADPGSTITEAPIAFAPGELVRLELPRRAPDARETDLRAVIAGDRAFGLDLLAVVAGDNNTMVSPYSIATALSMLYPGARGTTATEIADVLHLTVDAATLHAVRNRIDAELSESSGSTGAGGGPEPFTIRPVNSAWGQGGYPFLDDYLAVLAESYGAGLRLLDYQGDPEGSRAFINDWVADATEDRITDLIPPGGITIDTRLALVNAIWFKANWLAPFDADNTAPGIFTRLDGSDVEVPLMHADLRTGYAETELFEALRLPYAGDAAMVVALPKEGTPAELAVALGPEDLDIRWGDFWVDITLPSFGFDAEVALKPALQALGMKAAFVRPLGEGSADLTGITEVRELFVSEAFHKTFIALDEDGTEAAAATALIVDRLSLPRPATFTADRPFLFWIEHTPTGEMLFLGQVTDPS